MWRALGEKSFHPPPPPPPPDPPPVMAQAEEEARFKLGVAYALISEPFALVRGATAIISPLGLTSTSVVAMLVLVAVMGVAGSLVASCA